MLSDLQIAFSLADFDGSGDLDLDEFKEVVKSSMKMPGKVGLSHQYLQRHKLILYFIILSLHRMTRKSSRCL